MAGTHGRGLLDPRRRHAPAAAGAGGARGGRAPVRAAAGVPLPLEHEHRHTAARRTSRPHRTRRTARRSTTTCRRPGAKHVALELLDAAGRLVRRFASDDAPEPPVEGRNVPDYWIRPPQRLSAAAGPPPLRLGPAARDADGGVLRLPDRRHSARTRRASRAGRGSCPARSRCGSSWTAASRPAVDRGPGPPGDDATGGRRGPARALDAPLRGARPGARPALRSQLSGFSTSSRRWTPCRRRRCGRLWTRRSPPWTGRRRRGRRRSHERARDAAPHAGHAGLPGREGRAGGHRPLRRVQDRGHHADPGADPGPRRRPSRLGAVALADGRHESGTTRPRCPGPRRRPASSGAWPASTRGSTPRPRSVSASGRSSRGRSPTR